MTTFERAQAYARYFDTLTPASRDELKRLVHPDVHFVDPFNDIRGSDKLTAVFDHMFATTKNPRFKWRFTCAIEHRFYKKRMVIDGVSEVRFDEAGLIAAHIDYWDAARQLYEKLPLLGGLLRFVRRRLAVPV